MCGCSAAVRVAAAVIVEVGGPLGGVSGGQNSIFFGLVDRSPVTETDRLQIGGFRQGVRQIYTIGRAPSQLAHIGTYALAERVDEGAHIAGYALAVLECDWGDPGSEHGGCGMNGTASLLQAQRPQRVPV